MVEVATILRDLDEGLGSATTKPARMVIARGQSIFFGLWVLSMKHKCMVTSRTARNGINMHELRNIGQIGSYEQQVMQMKMRHWVHQHGPMIFRIEFLQLCLKMRIQYQQCRWSSHFAEIETAIAWAEKIHKRCGSDSPAMSKVTICGLEHVGATSSTTSILGNMGFNSSMMRWLLKAGPGVRAQSNFPCLKTVHNSIRFHFFHQFLEERVSNVSTKIPCISPLKGNKKRHIWDATSEQWGTLRPTQPSSPPNPLRVPASRVPPASAWNVTHKRGMNIDKMEVSVDGGTPSHHLFLDGISMKYTIPSIIGYPHFRKPPNVNN